MSRTFIRAWIIMAILGGIGVRIIVTTKPHTKKMFHLPHVAVFLVFMGPMVRA